jgi:hypothetical protein
MSMARRKKIAILKQKMQLKIEIIKLFLAMSKNVAMKIYKRKKEKWQSAEWRGNIRRERKKEREKREGDGERRGNCDI